MNQISLNHLYRITDVLCIHLSLFVFRNFNYSV